MKKRILSVLLTLVMMIGLVTVMSISASAAGEHTHCVCGEVAANDHTLCKSAVWTAWDGVSSISYTDNVAYVYLSGNAERSSTLTVESGYTLYLCLNGNTLSPASGFTGRAITVNSGATFVLTDCGGGGAISGFTSSTGGGGVRNSGTFTMYGGTISGNSTTGYGVDGDGGGVYNRGIFTMYGGTISGNTAASGGGGVYNYGGTFTMENVTISGNTAASGGGGVYISGGTFTMENVTVSDNTANTAESAYGIGGGGIYCSAGTLTVRGGSISGNKIKGTGTTYGGGIYVSRSATAEITDVTISGNTAYQGGGVYNYGTSTMENSTISGNTAYNGGGGVYNGGTFTMENVTVSGNIAAYDGGGVYNGGTFTMENVTVSDNTANNAESTYGAGGGGIYCSAGTLTVRGGIISGNEVKGTRSNYGGGIYVYSGATAEITDVTISGNTAYNGGGITVGSSATAKITDVTISGNTAYNGGGGVCNYGTSTMENSTISGNTANTYGGGVYIYGGTVNLSGNIKIIDNTKGTAGNLSPNNIYLLSDKTVTVAGALTCEDASIGVTMQSYNAGTFTTGGAAYIDKFVSDSSTYGIAVDGENLALKFQYTVTFDYGTLGSETKTVFKDETVTPPAPVFAGKVLVGWYADSNFTTEFNFSDAITNTTTTIYAKFADYEDDKEALNNKIDAAKSDLQAKIDAVNSALANKADAATLAQAVIDLDTAKTNIQTLLEADTTLKAELIAKIEAADNLIHIAISELTSRVETLESGLTAANGKISTNTTDIGTLKTDLSILSAWKTEAQNAIIALQDLTSTQNTNISKLQTAVADLQTAVNTANGKIAEVEDRIEALEGRVSALEKAEQELEAAVAALNAAIANKADTATLNQKVGELNEAITKAEATAKEYTDGVVGKLRVAIIAAKNEAVDAAKDLVDAAKEELQAAIDNKADTTVVNTKIANLQNAITALQNAKDNYIAADTALKDELEKAIAKAKEEAIDAAKGYIPYIGTNGNWWIGDTDTGVDANGIKGDTGEQGPQGEKGDKGDTGAQGPQGEKGDKGDTGAAGADGVGIAKIEKTSSDGNVDTYTITLTNGTTYTFTVTNGTNGTDGKDGVDGKDGTNGTGGVDGKDGTDGEDGQTPYIGGNGNWWIGDTDTGVKAAGDDGKDGAITIATAVGGTALISNIALIAWALIKKKRLF